MNKLLVDQKNEFREKYKEIRRSIPLLRRQEAKRGLCDHLGPLLKPYQYVLSFASKEDEISTVSLNKILEQRQQLVLPRVEKDRLELYSVNDIERDCIVSKWGIMEPDIQKCRLVDLHEISIVLVPGIAFDNKGHRIGYGRGFYDRLLSGLECETIGIGFREQKTTDLFPITSYDVACKQVLCF